MKTILAVIALALLSACATTPEPVVRSATTMNSGIPLSDGLKAYELGHYVLRLEIIPDEKAIAGSADVAFTANTNMDVLELDFDGLLAIDSITDSTGPLEYTRSDAKLFVNLRDTLAAGDNSTVTVAYHGKPVEAVRPPWDGGFQWATTPSGKPWVATAVQGEGCDIWWPCKDHPQGEPPGMDLHFTVPEGLTATSNGVLKNVETLDDGRRTFHWRTEVPTNTYGIAVNVAPYVLIEDTYTSVNGTEIPVMFWAIEDHEEPARALFEKEFFDVIEFFERKVGPYPWGQEKLGVTETSHLGMEHQTINAYGNEFRRGDFGFDWLFHHELAHEWFGNVMTHVTVSDMWLHEGFGAFMQPQYTLETMGEAAFHAAMLRTYRGISSCNAIAPKTEFSEDELYFDDVEGKGPAGDIYSKGTWLLHSLQNMIGDEVFWRSVKILVYDTPNPELLKPPIEARLRSTDDFMNIVNKESGRDLGWFFEVYARRGPLPELTASDSDDGVILEWLTPDDLNFPMPTPVRVNGEMQLVEFENNRAVLQGVSTDDILIDPYMQVLRKLPIVPTCEERRAEATANPHG